MFVILDNRSQMHLIQRIPRILNTFLIREISEIRRPLAAIREIVFSPMAIFVRFVQFVFVKAHQILVFNHKFSEAVFSLLHLPEHFNAFVSSIFTLQKFLDFAAYDVCNLENSVFLTTYDVSNAEIKFSHQHTTYVLPFFLFSLQHMTYVLPKIISARFRASYVASSTTFSALYVVCCKKNFFPPSFLPDLDISSRLNIYPHTLINNHFKPILL